MRRRRAQLHAGWLEAQLGHYTSFEDLWEELESVRDDRSMAAVLTTGDRFAETSEVVTPEQARRFERFELATVFAFDGPLEGPGLEIALSSDIRLCGPDATIRIPLGNRRSLALIGPEASAGLMATRGTVDAAAALACGFVSGVASSGAEAVTEARALAATIASRGPIAVRLGKEAIWRGLEMPISQALRFETDLTLLLQTTKDRAEGVRAFTEKRQPHFTGE